MALRRQLADMPAKEILRVVCKELKAKPADLKRRIKGGWVRPLVAYVLQKHGGLTQREVARELGLNTGAAVSIQVKRLKALVGGEERCARALARMEKRLDNLSFKG